MMDVSLDRANFEPIADLLDHFPELITTTLDIIGKTMHLAYYNSIEAQIFEGPRHGPKTIGRKLRPHGELNMPSNFPTNVWRDFGALQALLKWKRAEDEPDAVDVGLFEDAGDRVIAAASLEWGTEHIEPRPLFRPTTHGMKDRLAERIAQISEGQWSKYLSTSFR